MVDSIEREREQVMMAMEELEQLRKEQAEKGEKEEVTTTIPQQV